MKLIPSISIVVSALLLAGCSSNAKKHQHSWVEATCTTPKTCSICNETEGDPVGHTWEVIDGVMKCSVCGEIDETYTAIAKPLCNVPFDDGEEAVKKYLNISAQNNIQNRVLFLEDNGWIYGQAWDNQGKPQFVKVRTDGSDFTVLDNGVASYINVADGYIYYMLYNESEHGIYKMKTSGQDRQKISDAYGAMQIVDKQIYYYSDYEYETSGEPENYIVKPGFCHFFRCDLDGNNVTEIISKPTFHAYVFEDGILYQDDNDNSSLHICELDGSNDVKLNDAYSFFPIYDGEYIYYLSTITLMDAYATIWKIKPDGTENQKLSDINVNSSQGISMTYDNIYFVNKDDENRLYRIDKDGSNLTLITQDTNVAHVQLLNRYIKYSKYTDDYKYIEANYFCEYDGSGKWNFLDMID